MSGEAWQGFQIFGFFIALMLIAGFYCLFVTRNIIRTIIGLELLIKAVTLLIITAGYFTGKIGLTQSLVITVIVIEVVVVAVAGGIALRVFRYNDDLDERKLRNLKG